MKIKILKFIRDCNIGCPVSLPAIDNKMLEKYIFGYELKKHLLIAMLKKTYLFGLVLSHCK